MPDTAQEGVIKYHLNHLKQPLTAPPINVLNSWRRLLKKLDMIGQHPNRYQGYGFGNLSQRLTSSADTFLITGTQTGALSILSPTDYAIVTQANPEKNQLTAEGLVAPSSEALSHGTVYQTLPHIHFVFHVHCPDIWQHSQPLGIPCTAADIAYGTPTMAQALSSLLKDQSVQRQGIISMLGHEDGLISFGETAEQAGWPLIKYYTRVNTQQI